MATCPIEPHPAEIEPARHAPGARLPPAPDFSNSTLVRGYRGGVLRCPRRQRPPPQKIGDALHYPLLRGEEIAMGIRLLVQLLSSAAFAFVVAGTATAQTYPAKPIRVIVPVPAGSGLDTVARITIEKMAQNMGATMFVENIPGANSNIGAAAAARAAPDGYTLLVAPEALPLAGLTY